MIHADGAGKLSKTFITYYVNALFLRRFNTHGSYSFQNLSDIKGTNQ